MAKKAALFLVILITFLAAFLRLYKLDKIPNGFFFDEATISYQAFSVYKTGKDTWGTKLPLLSFRDYGEYILPVGVYGQIPAIFFGGLNVLAARFPHAILGALLVPAVYLLGSALLDKKTGVLAALLLSFSPLALGWSRFVFEGNWGALFFLLGVLFFVKKRLSLSAIFFGLSILSYHIFLVTTPLFVGFLILVFRPRSKKAAFIFAIFSLWALAAIYSGAGRERFSQASNLLTSEKLDVLNHQIGYCRQTLPGPVCRVFLNKATLVATSYLENYASHFSPEFLGFDGSFFRQNILPRTGLLPTFEIVAFYIGLYVLLKKRGFAEKLLLLLLAVYPASNSFTGTGEISRIAFAAPFLSLVSARGLTALGKRTRAVLLILIIASAAYFLLNYFTVFPITNAYYTDYGYDQVFNWVRANQSRYPRIFITRNYLGSVPYISALFFMPVDPLAFQTTGRVSRHTTAAGYTITDRIDNLYFYQDLATAKPSQGDFVIATPEELPKDQKWAFQIIDPTRRVLLVGFGND